MAVLSLALVAPVTASAQDAATDTVAMPGIEIALRPERNKAGNVESVLVTFQLTDTVPVAPMMEFRAPIELNNLPGIADRLRGFRVDDSIGAVLMTRTDDSVEASVFGYNRRWRTARSVTFPVTVTYRAIVPPGRLRAGPPFDLRTFAGGVSGGGAGFLALPQDARQYRVHIRWDLRDLGRGSVGVSSLGDGDAEATMALADLQSSWFMAGPLGRYPKRGNTGGFSAAWLGTSPGLDLGADMAWAAKAYKSLSMFFGDTIVHPYRFFLRVLPESTTSGGTAGNGSFMLQVPVRPKGSASGEDGELRSTIAHEMIHGWASSFEGAGPWASEGLATYFAANLQRRLGLQPIKVFVAELNRLSQQYNGNPYRNATGEAARAAAWADKNAESLQYVRGSLYFFTLDAAIRQASDGERSLDDILLELFARRTDGEIVSVRTFTNAVARVLGRRVAAELDSVVVRGTKTVFVPPDAFGPCFTHSWTQVVVPDFGFDRRTPGVQTVVGLVPTSAAAAAGLRNGDVITTPLAPELLVSDRVEQMKLDVVRGAESLYLTYMTSPMVNESWQWSRVPGVSLAVCRGGPAMSVPLKHPPSKNRHIRKRRAQGSP
ncbi:MAG TPA: hypothetical protein VFW03_23715 [Gemmatimonadaceae bacterium]|nr:hypothetical protein [Gemmatimonadaceae bacterium]